MLWLMCFQVYFKPSHRYIERELESSAKTKASTPQLILRRRSVHLSIFWGRVQSKRTSSLVQSSLIYLWPKGKKVIEGLWWFRFWRFMPKGERVRAQSKRTAPPPICKNFSFSKSIFKLVSYLWYNFKIGIPSSKLISKPSWTLRGWFH
jgi:hypothetical protein